MDRLDLDRLDLLSFVPFRLNRLATEFSNALAADYARFGIDIPEWRVMATLGMHDGPRSANYVVRCTRTHKSRISRAVGQLTELGFVEKLESDDDRREIMLQLTPKGREVYAELLPLLLAREEKLLSCLSKEQVKAFGDILLNLEQSLGLMNCQQ
ncbi:MarR family transcriptional regulator [Methylobacterium currus]|uniref:MarR family winged helix-turn-helix transcriptional regulator n=1 Tax=Methylobacterium currus TaxID=2051553 RepID=UPI001E3AF5BB|nr:MarR family transcriptional regulator [Methylobacterium currus]UHC19573.1 MarR family transcriptional regulator [Methylobacterium currus]